MKIKFDDDPAEIAKEAKVCWLHVCYTQHESRKVTRSGERTLHDNKHVEYKHRKIYT